VLVPSKSSADSAVGHHLTSHFDPLPLLVSKPASDDYKGLTERGRKLRNALTLSAESFGTPDLSAQMPFLLPQAARHRAILYLIGTRYEGDAAAAASQRRLFKHQILREHIREARE
jgi:hypothetical protein